jgi:hypothetical protein
MLSERADAWTCLRDELGTELSQILRCADDGVSEPPEKILESQKVRGGVFHQCCTARRTVGRWTGCWVPTRWAKRPCGGQGRFLIVDQYRIDPVRRRRIK